MAISCFVTTSCVRDLQRRLLAMLLLVQVPLPLLFGVLIPSPLFEGERPLRTEITPILPLTVAALVALAWILLRRCYRQWRLDASERTMGLAAVLSSPALIAVAVFMAVPDLPPPQICWDHFHTGEQLLPWQQLCDWGKVPYVDFVPIHGLMPLI